MQSTAIDNGVGINAVVECVCVSVEVRVFAARRWSAVMCVDCACPCVCVCVWVAWLKSRSRVSRVGSATRRRRKKERAGKEGEKRAGGRCDETNG